MNKAIRTAFSVINEGPYLEISPRETMQVLSYDKIKFWSWGANNFKNLEGKGVYFKVNGHHHKGYVMICLHPSDTFDVYFISTHGNIKEHCTNVYVDELTDLIDRKVEKIQAYWH